MECNCGGETKSGKWGFDNNKVQLTFQQCTSCGRIGDYRFIQDGKCLAVGAEAKDMYMEAEIKHKGISRTRKKQA